MKGKIPMNVSQEETLFRNNSEPVNSKTFRLSKLSTACLLCILGSTCSFASEDEGIGDISLEDLLNIEVTVASNFKETELESGSTVEAILKSQWRDYGAESVSDAIGHLPSTMIYPVPWGGSAVAIRGYASNLSVRGIATVLDGIPMNNLRTGSALYDIRGFTVSSLDRIEMIRGPGSALYGSDAFHGVISMKTYQSKENNTDFWLQASSEGFVEGNANHTSILGDIAINASITTIDQSDQDIPYSYTVPGTTTVQTSSRANAYDAYMGVFKISVPISDTFKTNYGIYLKSHDSIESVSGGQSQSPFGSIFLNTDITDGKDRLVALKGDFEANFDNEITLEGKAYLWESRVEQFTDTSLLPGFGGAGSLSVGVEEVSGVSVLVKQPTNPLNTQWAVGIDYKKNEVSKSQTYLTASGTDRTIIFVAPDIIAGFDRDVKGLVVSAKTKLIDDRLQIVYGGRYDKYSDFGNQTSPRFGVIFLPTEKQALKLLYGEAFRAPIVTELLGAGGFKGNPDLEPEVIETTELVYMYQSDSWKLNVTYFESEWTNGIILTPTTDPDFTAEYNNVGENESDGLEITYRGSSGNWRWDLSASFVSSESISATGNVDYAAFPEKIFNLNFGYRFEEENLDLFVTNRIHQDAKEGPISNNVPAPNDLDDYFATDVTLDWSPSKKWTLQLGIRNIFDEENFVPAVWNNENGVQTLGTYVQAGFAFKL
ncbi:TonB-dependent receptor plug domain-containing protein [Pleionea sediminis]|uniref:TonB-dependent receptor plug domain-containing protein n=1 Tax=Pleionea sediminis TaxID=2569479 RepID=UPI00118649F3|nr:TonB-dependent receptor [Pleionea sediminis]